MPAERNLDSQDTSYGCLWHRTRQVTRPKSYGTNHIAILKKPRFRQTLNLPISMLVKSASLPGEVIHLEKELKLFKTLFHDCSFISKCYGEEITYNTNNDVNKGLVPIHNLLLEHSYYDLASLIRNKDRDILSEDRIRRITRDILKGISFIHGSGYVHCGLSPEIVLVFDCADHVSAKIGDLGVIKEAKDRKKVNISGYIQRNLRYLAPEVVREKLLFRLKVVYEGLADVWAVGCIVIEMLTWKSMWDGKTDEEVEESLLEISKGSDSVKIPCDVSNEAKGFLNACLGGRLKRSTARKLLYHPFVASDDGEDSGEC